MINLPLKIKDYIVRTLFIVYCQIKAKFYLCFYCMTMIGG